VKPFKHRSGRWCIHYPPKLSPNGKDHFSYFDTQEAADADLKQRKGEVAEHGKSFVTAQERQWVLYLRNQIEDLDLIPGIVEHWKRTGAVTPITVQDAVTAFHKWQLPRVGRRTASDIRWRLLSFAEAFHGRYMHQLAPGELETWLYSKGAEWSAKSHYKRLRPLFDYGIRHRWLMDNPMERLRSPEVPAKQKAVYTAKQFHAMVRYASGIADDGTRGEAPYPDLVPFLVLSGFGFLRSKEIVREYLSDDALRWEDILWDQELIHIRESVGKQTRRAVGNERFVPMKQNDLLCHHLQEWKQESGFVVPALDSSFSERRRAFHAEVKIKAIKNGLRKSAISHALARDPELGIVQLARWAGSSESTIKGYYFRLLTQKQGQEWFSRKSLLLPF
jgi:integrase